MWRSDAGARTTVTVREKSRKIRIVINGIHAKSGGGVTYLRRILPEIADNPNLDLHLFLHREQFNLFYPIPDGVKVTVFNFKPSFISTLFWEQLSLPVIANSMGADVLFSPANYGPVFARNHVLLLRNAVSVIRLTNRLRPMLYWLALSGATIMSLLGAKRAIAVSKYAARILTFGLPSYFTRKVAVVYHGTQPIPARDQDTATDSNTILAVSDIYIQKNYHTLIQAFAKVHERHPELVLKIVGREIDSHYAAECKALVEKLGLGDRILFMGHMETASVIELYRNCLVFVFPSTVETFGNPLVEAMAAGAPIACSGTAAMPEVVEDAGLIFAPYDADDIAAKLLKLIEDPSLRDGLTKRGIERSKRFRWTETAHKTLDVLYEAADPVSAAPRQVR